MAIPFSNTTQRIPPGFANLLEGLAREVLRNQPEDIPTFAAKYFEALLIEREKTGFDPSEWGAKIEDRFYNNHAFNELAPPGDGVKTMAEEGAPKEKEVKKTSQEAISDLTEEQAAIKIQAHYRGYITRKHSKNKEEGGGGEGAVKEVGEEEPSNEPDEEVEPL